MTSAALQSQCPWAGRPAAAAAAASEQARRSLPLPPQGAPPPQGYSHRLLILRSRAPARPKASSAGWLPSAQHSAWGWQHCWWHWQDRSLWHEGREGPTAPPRRGAPEVPLCRLAGHYCVLVPAGADPAAGRHLQLNTSSAEAPATGPGGPGRGTTGPRPPGGQARGAGTPFPGRGGSNGSCARRLRIPDPTALNFVKAAKPNRDFLRCRVPGRVGASPGGYRGC